MPGWFTSILRLIRASAISGARHKEWRVLALGRYTGGWVEVPTCGLEVLERLKQIQFRWSPVVETAEQLDVQRGRVHLTPLPPAERVGLQFGRECCQHAARWRCGAQSRGV